MTQSKPSIFISYGRGDDHEDYNDPDKSFLRKLYNDLTADDYNVWWDRVSMPSRGLNFMQEIQDAITKHDKLILIVGPHAIGSDYVRYEWQYALRICKPVIPILLKRDPKITEDKDQYGQVPIDVHAINALDWDKNDKYVRVLAELKRILGEDAPLGKTHNLPLPPRGYIEREGFARLQADLLVKTSDPVVIAPHEQVVSVQGAGGIGKSTLAGALAWSCEVRRHYVDGVYWIRLGKVEETDIVERQATLGRQLGDDGANYTDEQSGRARLSYLLADKKALLILDDVWDHRQKEAFDAISANSRILITTRLRDVALITNGEPHVVNHLTEAEGIKLIGEWLGREAEAENPHEAEERQIVNLLGGYTLAIAIASAKLADQTTGYDHAELLKRLEAGRIFNDIQLDPQDKNLNLEKSLLLSYEDLSGDDQKRFRQLGALAPNADFDERLVQAVWDDDEFEVKDALNRLVSEALLDRDDSGRWRQHSVLRMYAQALLSQEEQDQTFIRYVQYITEISTFEALPMQDWDSQIGPNYPHIDYVGDTLIERYKQLPDTYRALASDFIWKIQHYVNDRPVYRNDGKRRGLDWLNMGAEMYTKLEQKDRRLVTLNNIGTAYSALGDGLRALDYFQKALPILREVGNRGVEATVLSNIGTAYSALGDGLRALDYFQKALPILREVGNRGVEATVLSNIGTVYLEVGDGLRALDYFQQALPISREVDDRNVEAITLNNIGIVYSALGDKKRALEYYLQALPLLGEVRNRSVEAKTLDNVGRIYNALGDKKRALEYYLQALPISRDVGDRSVETIALDNIGRVYFDLGDKKRALEYHQRALPIQREVKDLIGEATTLNNIGRVYSTLDDMQQALEYYQQALPIFRELGDRAGEAVAYYNIGMIYRDQGDLDTAIEYIERTVKLDEEIQHPDLESDRQMLEKLKQQHDEDTL